MHNSIHFSIFYKKKNISTYICMYQKTISYFDFKLLKPIKKEYPSSHCAASCIRVFSHFARDKFYKIKIFAKLLVLRRRQVNIFLWNMLLDYYTFYIFTSKIIEYIFISFFSFFTNAIKEKN